MHLMKVCNTYVTLKNSEMMSQKDTGILRCPGPFFDLILYSSFLHLRVFRQEETSNFLARICS